MIKYLVFDTATAADARSRAAWTPGPGDTITVRMWDVFPHPSDGRAALVIPAGSEGALTEAERTELVDALPTGWIPEDAA